MKDWPDMSSFSPCRPHSRHGFKTGHKSIESLEVIDWSRCYLSEQLPIKKEGKIVNLREKMEKCVSVVRPCRPSPRHKPTNLGLLQRVRAVLILGLVAVLAFSFIETVRFEANTLAYHLKNLNWEKLREKLDDNDVGGPSQKTILADWWRIRKKRVERILEKFSQK